MNLIRSVSAIYKEQELPEYRGNPLIEALPEALTEDEVLLEMSYFPEIDEKSAGLPRRMLESSMSNV